MSDTKKFSCPRCDFAADLKANLSAHLKNKKPCETKYSTISREDALEDLKRDRKLPSKECEYCGKTFCTKRLKQHVANCSKMILNYGQETIAHLTTEFLTHCLLNPTKGITQMLETIHYNADEPHNKNIRFKSSKHKTYEKYIAGQWIECDASNTLDELIRKSYRILNEHYVKNFLESDDTTREFIERFRFLADAKSVYYKAVKRDIRLLIKNKS
jgi:hypothetical protein